MPPDGNGAPRPALARGTTPFRQAGHTGVVVIGAINIHAQGYIL